MTNLESQQQKQKLNYHERQNWELYLVDGKFYKEYIFVTIYQNIKEKFMSAMERVIPTDNIYGVSYTR